VETDIITAPRIKWVSYGPQYWAGYLNGEEGANHSYSIRQILDKGKSIYRLIGRKFYQPLDCLDLESAKLFAEERETNE
jgi:hypothetical protein